MFGCIQKYWNLYVIFFFFWGGWGIRQNLRWLLCYGQKTLMTICYSKCHLQVTHGPDLAYWCKLSGPGKGPQHQVGAREGGEAWLARLASAASQPDTAPCCTTVMLHSAQTGRQPPPLKINFHNYNYFSKPIYLLCGLNIFVISE